MSEHEDQDLKSVPVSLQRRVSSLSPTKRAVFLKRFLNEGRSRSEQIKSQPDEEVYPLSFQQQRVYFIEQLQPGSSRYHISRAFHLDGPLNRRAIESALHALVERHEMLRTSLHSMDGEVGQRIHPPSRLVLGKVDLCTTTETPEEKEQKIQHGLNTEGRRIFDLFNDILFRAVLYQMSAEEHVLQFTMHHLVGDGWSLGLMFRELEEIYRATLAGESTALSTPDVRYVDFARWQRKTGASESFRKRVDWWLKELEGTPPDLNLLTDKPRPSMESVEGSFTPLELPCELIERLERLAQQEDATLYMILLTAFFILLRRYTGMEELVVGSITGGRQRPETHGVVGFFADTVALRVDLSGDPNVVELLGRVRRTVLNAMEHSDVPFERIVESLKLPRNLDRHPVFQVLFNAPPEQLFKLDDLRISPIRVDLRRSRFDFELTYLGVENPATGFTWNTGIFNQSTIDRMLGHYLVLLKAIADDLNQPLGQLPLLTQSERQQQLVEWNDTMVDFSDDCVHELFEAQVKRTPDAIAVLFENQKLTYQQLNARSNQLAHHLQSLNIGSGSLVGLGLQRSADLVMGILGILKAGAAYLPLDADYPEQRLEFMLSDANVGVIVAKQELRDRIPAKDRLVIWLDAEAVNLKAQAKTNLELTVSSKEPAYVIYTSGSTGKPKGVEIYHRNVCNLLLGIEPVLGIGSGDRFLGVATPSFDISVAEILIPLVTGATTVLVNRETVMDADALAEEMNAKAPTIVQATPSYWQMLLDSGWKGRPQFTLISTGEALPRSLARRLLGTCKALYDFYGPTETTIWSTARQVTDNDLSGSIGRPIANTQVYVMDSVGNTLPIGIPGELYIGGLGLARGYINRPEMTADRFVANPFAADPDSRLFRTGDLCRWREDGTLEILGRLDHQVKLRGFRIELGEIETVIGEHPDVTQCVVIALGNSSDDKRLVAYCLSKDIELNTLRLKDYLRDRFPDYMIPATFVRLAKFPETFNGKVDRRALPAPDELVPEQGPAFIAPRTPVEEVLVAIFYDLFGIERIGIRDNFFDLGGHSILAFRLIARIKERFNIAIAIRTIFDASTIEELAQHIHDQQTALN